MSDPQQKPAVKPKVEPEPPAPAPGREKVRIRWALGGPFVEGEFDPASGLVHCKRNGKKVRISIHGPIIHWIEDAV
jgi:hypothetical protein